MKITVEREKLKLQVPKGVEIRVGWFEDQKYDDSTSIAQVAYWQEYGTKNGIPMRPFMRVCKHEQSRNWVNTLGKELKKSLFRKGNLDISAKRLGEKIKGDIQESIINGDWEPNRPSTVRKKGFNKPLIDTGIMLHSIQSRTNKEE